LPPAYYYARQNCRLCPSFCGLGFNCHRMNEACVHSFQPSLLFSPNPLSNHWSFALLEAVFSHVVGSLISPRTIISHEFTGRASCGSASEMQNGEETARRIDHAREGHWGSSGWVGRKRGNRPGRSYRTDAGSASTSSRRMKSESPTLVIIRAQKAPTATPAKNCAEETSTANDWRHKAGAVDADCA